MSGKREEMDPGSWCNIGGLMRGFLHGAKADPVVDSKTGVAYVMFVCGCRCPLMRRSALSRQTPRLFAGMVSSQP